MNDKDLNNIYNYLEMINQQKNTIHHFINYSDLNISEKDIVLQCLDYIEKYKIKIQEELESLVIIPTTGVTKNSYITINKEEYEWSNLGSPATNPTIQFKHRKTRTIYIYRITPSLDSKRKTGPFVVDSDYSNFLDALAGAIRKEGDNNHWSVENPIKSPNKPWPTSMNINVSSSRVEREYQGSYRLNKS